MTSHAQAETPLEGVEGLVFFSFPLHPAGQPDISRAEHLRGVNIAMLFLSGTRDALGTRELLEPVVSELPAATLHLLDTADHSFKVLKKTRESTEDVFDEIARVVKDWAENI